jgi:hypothetical protein
VALEIPTGLVSAVREDGACARLGIGAVELKFEAAGLLLDCIVVLNGDGVVRMGAEMEDQRIAEVEKGEYDETPTHD